MTASQPPRILSDESAFVTALEQSGATIKGRMCSCPFHDDRSPSAQWSQGNDGTWRMYCHVCQRHANVIDLMAHQTGKDPKDVFKAEADKESPSDAPREPVIVPRSEKSDLILADKRAVVEYAKRIGDVQAWSTYGPKSSPVLVVARIMQSDGKKTFRQFTPLNDGTYAAKNKLERGTIPLYHADEFTADKILVVEGEKCADAARSVGICATTSAMGAGKADQSDWKTLIGKTAYLWPDNDDTGRKHMADVRKILERIGVNYRMIQIDFDNMPKKYDVADFIESLSGKSELEIGTAILGIMEDADPETPSDELHGLISDIESGKFCAIGWPTLTLVGSLSKALLPGTVTSLCADPGAGKSLIMLQMLADWHMEGIRVALLALEDERRIHMQRVLAQMAKDSDLADDEYVRNNPDLAREFIQKHKATLDSIGQAIKAEGEEQLSLAEITEWTNAKAKEGARIIIVDPVTAAKTEREPWAADTTFIMGIKRIAREYGSSVILVTHPRGQSKGASLGGMAGGSAYPRFSHAALWLEKFETTERRALDGSIATCNRSIKITKSRHGKGGGMTIGMVFDGATLRFGNQAALAPEEPNAKRTKPGKVEPAPKRAKPDDPSRIARAEDAAQWMDR